MSGMIGLRNIRKAKNLYQQKVAMDLNITREALSHYENGRREPTLAMLVRMSEYFHVSIDCRLFSGLRSYTNIFA